MTLESYQNYINGQFVTSTDHFTVENPANQDVLAYIPSATQSDIDAAIDAARQAQKSWAKKTAIERAQYLKKIANKIRENVPRLARIIVEEQSKVASLAEVEVNFTADYLDYMAEWARRLEGEIIQSDRANEQIFLFRKPLGVVAGILPWNFPFFLIARKMAPALLTGNTIVIKPSEETPINCFEFAKLVAETDLPAGVFNVLGGKGEVGGLLSSSSEVDMISFTGSIATGSRIQAASAPNITKLNLELGGKAPAIVLNDANLDLAANAIWNSRVINTGQVCNCVERVYVQREIADQFIEKVTALMQSTQYGDPSKMNNLHMGSLINQQGLNKIDTQVKQAIEQGAKVVTGGNIADLGQGYHYQPTVLINCNNSMDILHKEIFGPVLPIAIVDDLDQAIEYSNDCEYGLTSSIFSQNINSVMQACRELSFGETYVNREHFEAMQGFHAGVRKSGVGGADGKHGLYEYMHTHVVYMQN
ncbi:aldehyde dehydrogenase [Acinetobacter bereziniae]|jgi:lactaldehyde dehydrogenase/glycolaldehyde dehydrogenase|uniref:aldehyde dehydrogenase n=1 Tax=Acinetobacter bereziniae TaxID=106648 RepID=UPI0032B420F4